jgi:hypothetical protein
MRTSGRLGSMKATTKVILRGTRRDELKSKNIEDWTFEEILEGIGETFNGMLVQKLTKNEPLYPIMRNALRWTVITYMNFLKEEENSAKEEARS